MLGRRIVGPRDVVFLTDPAVSPETDSQGYIDAAFDMKSPALKIVEGETPTVWSMAPLTDAQRRQAKTMEMGEVDWNEYVFCCAIHGIKGYIIDEEGKEPREVEQPDRGEGDRASVEWLRRSGIASQDIDHGAQLGWLMSEARPPLSKLSGRPAGP